MDVFVVMMRIAARAIERSAMTARQKFLVIHMTDPAGAEWDQDIDGARLQRWLEFRDGPDGWEANGQTVAGPEQARRITAHGGDLVVTDGPFPEFAEWFLGVEWIEATDIEQATRLLAEHSTARIGRMYVIPASGD